MDREGPPEEIVYLHTCRNCGCPITAPGEARRFVHEWSGSKFCNPASAREREWYSRIALPTAERDEGEEQRA
jgi:hypothetical protein